VRPEPLENTVTSTDQYKLDLDTLGSVEVTVTQTGEGRPYLLLHGGAGPLSVTPFAELLAAGGDAHVLVPTHPGFGGTPRPDGLTDIASLAAVYARLLDDLDLTGVTVIGNSIGGWIAAELELLAPTRLAGVILVNAVGIEVPGHPIADFFSLTMDQVAELSYHDPDKFRIDVSAMPPALRTIMAGNRATLAVYSGATMNDAGLATRLAAATVPTVVLWGEADQIVDADYGRAFAAAIPGARFQLLTETGHVPQIETPDQLLRAIRDFTDGHPAA
jgi:pimeloyl-ACP methyl ester carboxylesterase